MSSTTTTTTTTTTTRDLLGVLEAIKQIFIRQREPYKSVIDCIESEQNAIRDNAKPESLPLHWMRINNRFSTMIPQTLSNPNLVDLAGRIWNGYDNHENYLPDDKPTKAELLEILSKIENDQDRDGSEEVIRWLVYYIDDNEITDLLRKKGWFADAP